MADEREDADEHDELDAVARAGLGQHLPQQPEHRLRDRDRPHRSVEVAALVSFSLGRSPDARQIAKRAEQPHRSGDREIGDLVHLLQAPLARQDGVGEAGDVQHRERDDLSPRGRVADAAIQRVRAILGEANDVRPRLAARQTAAQAGDRRADQHHTQPDEQARIEAALEEIERQRPWRDEEHENPDRPVIEPVVQLVPVTNLPIDVALDVEGVCGELWFRRHQQSESYQRATRPSSMISTRCAHARANSSSCVATTIVRPSEAS